MKKFIVSFLLSFIVLGNINAVSAAEKNLAMYTYSQEKSNWCWVTGAQIVSRYLTSTIYSQCELYKAGIGGTSCSGNLGGGFYGDMTRALERGNVYPGYATNEFANMTTIVKEINRNAPLLIRFGWKNTNLVEGHMIVVRGYNTDNDYVRYIFPLQSASFSDKTSELRSNSYAYTEENSSWKTTHSRWNMY